MNQPKKRLRWLVAVIAAILSVTASSAALSAELTGEETFRLAEGEILDDDLYIAASEIYIDGIVQGDLIAVASYIEIGPSGVIEGDLWAMAAGVEIHGAVLDDLRAVAGGLAISGVVGDDAFLGAGGGQADIPTGMGTQAVPAGLRVTGRIGGDTYVAAGGADISGGIGGDFLGAMGLLEFSGAVTGETDIQVGEFIVSNAARFEGGLRYSAPEPRQFPAGVARDIQFEAPTGSETAGGTIAGAFFGWVFRTVAIAIGIAILGWLLMRFRPSILARPAAAIQSRPVETGLYGLLAAALLIFIPVATIILVAFTWTFWGAIPGIAMFVFLAAASALVWFLSPLLTGIWLGERIGERLGGRHSPLHLLLLGALLIVVLGRIPFLGWLVYLLSFVLALGGILRSGSGAVEATEPEAAAAP